MCTSQWFWLLLTAVAVAVAVVVGFEDLLELRLRILPPALERLLLLLLVLELRLRLLRLQKFLLLGPVLEEEVVAVLELLPGLLLLLGTR
jgi:hypothetical protein